MIVYLYFTDQHALSESKHRSCHGILRICPEILFELYTEQIQPFALLFQSILSLISNKTEKTYIRFQREI